MQLPHAEGAQQARAACVQPAQPAHPGITCASSGPAVAPAAGYLNPSFALAATPLLQTARRPQFSSSKGRCVAVGVVRGVPCDIACSVPSCRPLLS